MRNVKRILLLTSALVALGPPVRAAVTDVTASPTSASAPLTRSISLHVGWTLRVEAAGLVTVSSNQGWFRSPDGTLLGTVARRLSKPLDGAGRVAFKEAVQVPADVLQRAHRAGFDQLFYERRFTDGAAASGRIRIYITTTSSTGFAVSRLVLAFDDGNPLAVVCRNAELTLQAELSLVGMGLLRAVWEVAGPNADARRPVWRALA